MRYSEQKEQNGDTQSRKSRMEIHRAERRHTEQNGDIQSRKEIHRVERKCTEHKGDT